MSLHRLLLGTSMVLAGMGAIATAPVAAFSLTPTNITFNTTNYQTYTGGNNGSFLPGNLNAAIAALTDHNPASNVELWYTTEVPTTNAGFSANLGNLQVSVSSVTGADWAIFGSQWLTDLTNRYNITLTATQRTAILADLIAMGGLPRANDPNIGSLTYDGDTHQVNLLLVGHYDLRERIATYMSSNPVSPWNALIQQAAKSVVGPLQASEIARVTLNGQVSYAYSFYAQNSGVVTNDGTESYTGLYTWQKTLPDPVSVPEPSMLLGAIAIGGLCVTKRRKRQPLSEA